MSNWKMWLAGLTLLFCLLGLAACSPSLFITPGPDAGATSGSDPVPDAPVELIVLRPGIIPDALLLGGVRAGTWVAPADALARAGTNETYAFYDLDGLAGVASGVSTSSSPVCAVNFVQVSSAPQAVGLTGTWNAIPRLAQSLSTDAQVYRAAVEEFLVQRGVTAPEVNMTQLLRVDFEGDGVDEVLINAARFSDPGGHAVRVGDYAVLLLRRVNGSEVETFPLVEDIYFADSDAQFPWSYTILAAPDLNGDGVLELAVELSRWESAGGRIYQFTADGPALVFEQACGR